MDYETHSVHICTYSVHIPMHSWPPASRLAAPTNGHSRLTHGVTLIHTLTFRVLATCVTAGLMR